jgi:hypothetical protein
MPREFGVDTRSQRRQQGIRKRVNTRAGADSGAKSVKNA